MDQHNSFRNLLENGDVALGAGADSFAPALVELYGELGLDYVWLDFEHNGPSPWDSQLLENLARAAELTGIELLVRIPDSDPALIRKVFDTGVRNVLIPRVDSAEEVRSCVEAARYEHNGRPGERGNSVARFNTWRTVDRYMEREDGSVSLGVMIEKATALDDLDAILDVPELGFAFIGPSDLSVQLGYDKSDPAFSQQLAEIRDSCLDAGVPVGCIRSDPENAKQAIAEGYQIVQIASEYGAITKIVGDRLRTLRDT